LIPGWVSVRDQVAIWIQGLCLFFGGFGRLWCNGAGHGFRLDQFLLLRRCSRRCRRSGLGIQRADLQLLPVLLEDALVVVLPELLGRVFAGNALEDYNLSVSSLEPLWALHTLLAARVFVLELGQVVYIFVDDDPEVVGFVVRRHVGGRKSLRHFECVNSGEERRQRRKKYK